MPTFTAMSDIHNYTDFHKLKKLEVGRGNRPMLSFSFALNYYFHEFEVFDYHVGNLLIHLIVCILAYIFICKLFQDSNLNLYVNPKSPDSMLNKSPPLFAALLFATHPIKYTSSQLYLCQVNIVMRIVHVCINKKGMLDLAIEEFKKTTRLKENYPGGHFNLAVTLDEKGSYDDAVTKYKHAIRLKPDNIIAMHNLSKIYMGKKSMIMRNYC